MTDARRFAPRPQPVFRVGITGDRLADLLGRGAALAGIRREVRAALTAIQHAVHEVASGLKPVFEGSPVVHVVTALHDGAELIAAEEAIALECELQVPLPCPPDRFVEAFKIPAEYAGIDPRQTVREILKRDRVTVQVLYGGPAAVPADISDRASEAAVVRHSDLLIVISDHRPVERERDQARVLSTDEALRVVRIAPRAPGGWQLSSSQLREIVEKVMAPPQPGPKDGDKAIAPGPLMKFFTTPAALSSAGCLFALLVKILAFERPRFLPQFVLGYGALDRARREWDAMWEGTDPAIAGPLAKALKESYVWADTFGNGYGTLHRDSSTLPYLLAPWAVLFALAAHFGSVVLPCANEVWWLMFGALEIATLIAIVGYYLADVFGHFHDLWIDYRSLAELLRQLTFLWPLGRSVPAARFSGETQDEAAKFTWIAWYVRAVTRQAGLFPGMMSSERLATMRQILADKFITHQCEYHGRTARRFQNVYERLHVLGMLLFSAALLSAAIHWGWEAVSSPAFNSCPPGKAGVTTAGVTATQIGLAVTALAAIWLPACGAAVHGFMSHGDFWNLSRRSERMCANLETLRGDVERTPADVDALGAVAEQAAETMSEELLYWRVFTRLKPAALV